jgi:hypothetical protein
MLSPPKDGRAPNLTPRCPARTAVSSRSTTEPAARTRPAKLLQNAATATTTDDNGTPPARRRSPRVERKPASRPQRLGRRRNSNHHTNDNDAPNQGPIGSEPGGARPDTSALSSNQRRPPAQVQPARVEHTHVEREPAQPAPPSSPEQHRNESNHQPPGKRPSHRSPGQPGNGP